jgi:hypothetical protein
VKVSLGDLFNSSSSAKGVVHSIEGSIYLLSVIISGKEMRVVDRDGKVFRRQSIQEVREALQGTCVASLVLTQQSAYDEMIGQSVRQQENTLEVQLAPATDSDGIEVLARAEKPIN